MAVTSKSASGLTGKGSAADQPADSPQNVTTAPELSRPSAPAESADRDGERAPVAKLAADSREARIERRECVVDDGTAHMGRAVPGKLICSAHEMHYLPDGTSRLERHLDALEERREKSDT